MSLLPTTDLWRATIDGNADLALDFTMPAGSTEGQARYRVCEIWSPARCASWTPDRPAAAHWLRLEKVAVAMAVASELAEAA